MNMRRIVISALFALSLLGACDKPNPESCRKALLNMQHLMDTENLLAPGQLETEVRSCRSGSSREAVECATNATTLDELRHCKFYKVPEGSGSAGSAK